MSTTPTLFPLVFQRQQAEPIDIDAKFATTSARIAYLSSPRAFAGLVAFDVETNGLYYIVETGGVKSWIQLGTSENTSYSATLIGSSTSYIITHNLGTKDVIVQLYEISSGETIYSSVVRTDNNNITINFDAASGSSAYRVVIKK